MVHRHYIDELGRNTLGVLLLDQLRKHALQIRERQRSLQLRRRRVSENLALRDNDDAMTDNLDHLEHVRDVKNRFALGSQLLQEILKQPRGDDIEPRERFVKDE